MTPLEQCPLDRPDHSCALYLEVHKHPKRTLKGWLDQQAAMGLPLEAQP